MDNLKSKFILRILRSNMMLSNYSLSVPLKVSLDEVKRLNLTVEAGTTLDKETLSPYGERITTAHAPYSRSGMGRLNIAAVDDDFREESIKIIEGYIHQASQFSSIQKVIMHCAPKRWYAESQTGGNIGIYERLIDGLQYLANVAAKLDITIALENNRAYWDGIPDDVPAEDANREGINEYFGAAPDEWLKICDDLNKPNFFLCLDSSHACTYAQIESDHAQRQDIMMAYLAKPDFIGHVHWNDNYLYDVQGRKDSHLCIGKGTIPRIFHETVRRLNATLLLEHFYTIEELEEELRYIDNL